ncbi:hypothetical protein [Paraliomyxa miuraensis]|uniref:hypothetical protein n=1 Tax=Paraliomyxa miuraensis TaxID=376150 RepID=UPI002256F3DA|nr:hypothetical protein [Paraliomyxa miuraensis]MCX4247640.1 hypothetical protein [Paraliomyxa miuraensis]
MQVPCVIDHVGFQPPAELEDATRYAFGDDDGPESLTVELEAPAGGATPATTVLEEVRESISTVFPFGQVLDQGETVLDGRRAWFLAYEVGPDAEHVAGMVVVANLPEGDHVKLHLRVAALDLLGPRFGPTLESVSLSGGPAPRPAGPEYRRERVGPIALDVARALVGPRSRTYVDAEDRLRLRLAVRPVGASMPALDDGVAEDARGGELLDREERSWSWGWWVRHRQRGLTPPHRERAVVRAGLVIGSPRSQGAEAGSVEPTDVRMVEVFGTAEPERASILHAAFDALLASLRWHEEPSSSAPTSAPGGEEPSA